MKALYYGHHIKLTIIPCSDLCSIYLCSSKLVVRSVRNILIFNTYPNSNAGFLQIFAMEVILIYEHCLFLKIFASIFSSLLISYHTFITLFHILIVLLLCSAHYYWSPSVLLTYLKFVLPYVCIVKSIFLGCYHFYAWDHSLMSPFPCLFYQRLIWKIHASISYVKAEKSQILNTLVKRY